MNANIIPQGSQESITDGSLTAKALVVFAETDVVISNLVFRYPPSTPNDNNVDTFTLKAGRWLGHIESMDFTGTITVIYAGA